MSTEFEYEALTEAHDAAGYLEALAAGIRAGQLTLTSGDDPLDLRPQGLMKTRLTSKRGARRARLTVRLSWREGDAQDVASGAPLKITSGPTGA